MELNENFKVKKIGVSESPDKTHLKPHKTIDQTLVKSTKHLSSSTRRNLDLLSKYNLNGPFFTKFHPDSKIDQRFAIDLQETSENGLIMRPGFGLTPLHSPLKSIKNGVMNLSSRMKI